MSLPRQIQYGLYFLRVTTMTEHHRNRIFTALFTIVFAVTLGFSVVNPFLPVYMKTLTSQGFMIALVFSSFSLSKILFTPLLGRWSDLKSRKCFIVCGLIIHSLIACCFVFLPVNLILIIALRFLQGIATAMVRPVAQAFVGDISRESHLGLSMGTFDISFYAALAIGPVLGGIVGNCSGFRGMFLVLMILCSSALIVALFTDTGEPMAPAPLHHRQHHLPGKSIFSNQTLQALFCFIFSRSFSIAVIPIFLPLFIDSHLHSGYLDIGICLSSGSIVTALLLRPMSSLSDRLDRRMLVIIGGIMSGIFTILLPLAGSLWQVVVLSISLALFTTLTLPASTALLVDKGRLHGLGYTMGIFHTVMNIGAFTAPLLGGVLMDTVGIHSIFSAAGLLGIAGSLLFALRCPHSVQEKTNPQYSFCNKSDLPQQTATAKTFSRKVSPVCASRVSGYSA